MVGISGGTAFNLTYKYALRAAVTPGLSEKWTLIKD